MCDAVTRFSIAKIEILKESYQRIRNVEAKNKLIDQVGVPFVGHVLLFNKNRVGEYSVFNSLEGRNFFT